MLLVIVGAGASFDSDWRRRPNDDAGALAARRQNHALDFRPPLAKDLFDESRFGNYVAEYPPSQGLMVRLRRAVPAIEQELERIREDSGTQETIPRMLLAVRFYLRDVIRDTVEHWVKGKPDRITNFTRLVGGVEKWRQSAQERVVVVTFNYDSLFEEALTNLLPNFRLRGVDDYISDPRYKVFKLHGSVNWWREVSGEWVQSGGLGFPDASWAPTLFNAPGPYVEDGLFHLTGSGTVGPVVPRIAIPTTTKGPADFACPEHHLPLLEALLKDVTDVLVIGWSGNENHFQDLWRRVNVASNVRLRSLAVVDAAMSDAQNIQAQLTGAIGAAGANMPLYETFSGFVDEKLDSYIGGYLH